MKFSQTLLRSACSALLMSPTWAWSDDIIQTTATTTVEVPEAASSTTAKAAAETVPAPAFVPLITGTGLDGWVVHEGKQAAWKRDGEIISCLSSTGGWLRTQATYSDFVLRLEYRLRAGGNTGIGLRAPSAGNPTFTGLEIQLLDDTAPKYADLRADQYTGSVYYQVPATKRAQLKPLGEWNSCEIRCLGDEVTVKINGEQVNQISLARQKQEKGETDAGRSSRLLSQRPPLGHLALQSHSTRVDFRGIEVQDLTVTTPSGLQYVELSPGTGEVVGEATSVTLHYVGQLTSGKRFTDTRDLGSPIQVPVESTIPGLQEGIQGMRVNGRRRLIVPPQLGYGPQGVGTLVPPDATLVFEIEICSATR